MAVARKGTETGLQSGSSPYRFTPKASSACYSLADPMRFSVALLLLAGVLPAQERVDLPVVNRIKSEAFSQSTVMDTAFYLTDVHGPRLTGSPALRLAGEWAAKRMLSWGVHEPRLEPWGPFGRGWVNLRFAAHLTAPGYAPLIGFARPWSPGTKGAVAGEPVLAPIRSEADFAKYKGKLKGKIVLTGDARPLAPIQTPLSKRLTEDELSKVAISPEPAGPRPAFDAASRRSLRNAINRFLIEEGVLLTVVPSFKRDVSTAEDLSILAEGGTVFGTQAGSPSPEDPLPPPSIGLATEHYNRIARLLEHKIPVTVEIEVENRIIDEQPESFTVVGEIPGSGKRDEVVMIGAHLDSWSFGTGATDNAAGSAVAMEVMRILTALNLKMDRTVRIGLWTGEEQGLLGSRAWVKQNLADPATMSLKPAHAKLSGYFNYDNGGGKIRGVYLQNNDMMRPIFEAWLAPFRDLGVTTTSIRDTGGTDHLAFDAVGLPGFQFIQDPLEYMTRTHHSNMDTYDRLQAPDLMQSAAVMASVVYHAATRPEMLPRKPLPKPASPRAPAGRKSGAGN
jgi:carboxypeptidase Q